MFFQISKTKQDNFPYNHQTANFVVSLDEGWQHIQYQNNDIWYKGYLDSGNLRERVIEISNHEEPTYYGNFCVIKVTLNGLSIKTDKLRSFPIWYDYEKGVTNLREFGAIQWTGDLVDITNDWVLIHSKFNAIGETSDSLLTFDQVVDQVDALLDLKVKTFLTNSTLPLKVFLSGGIDTGLLFSYIQKHTDKYELITYNHLDHDYFYLKNHGYLSKLWGYNQIHHWKDACVLASGAPGDEFTCRNPITVDMLLRYHGSSFVETFNDPEFINSLNYSFFERAYIEKLTKTPNISKHNTLPEVIHECCEYNINDWQHWHIGNTLTWTPFRDIELFKLFARLKLDDLKRQLMESAVQIELIRRNNPIILTYLSTQKNSLNSFENLTNILKIG